ncbi:MAG TPA: beta-ketoacyl-[acyl-carrier-protein] synthase II [Chloroflexi bacterium]|nr:beta-ketoacyl-[acyl-carrier-protein] synthase II [Chloroflexota bacterium]
MSQIVVTGLGAITPIGNTVATYWQSLLAGRSGVGPVTAFDASPFPTQIAAEVKDFDPSEYMDRKEARRMARCSQLAVAATHQALADAGLSDGFADAERVAVLFGTAIGGFEQAYINILALQSGGWKRVNPFAIPAMLPNMPGHHVSTLFGTHGYIGTVTTACASGTQAIVEAAHLIRRGAADVVITGGTEALINELTFAGFCAMRGMSTRNHDPERAVRPFDRDRDGFLMGEGAGVLILEREDLAQARGARIYCRVLGGAASSDAFHMAQPDPEGAGAVRAMRWALQNAGSRPEAIDYINAHGPGTPIGDAIETKAIKRLFGERAYEIPISSTKSMIAHGMGAAGALEAIACVKTIETQTIHPTINYETQDPECDLDYVPEGPLRARVRYTLSNSFGLGGQNACLVLGSVNGASHQ